MTQHEMLDREKFMLGLMLLDGLCTKEDLVWSNDLIVFPPLTDGSVAQDTHSRLYELGFCLIEENASEDFIANGRWCFPLSAHEQYRQDHPYRPKRKKG